MRWFKVCIEVPCIIVMLQGLADDIVLDKDMCTCGEAVGNVNSAMMRTDRRSVKLLHGRLEALYE